MESVSSTSSAMMFLICILLCLIKCNDGFNIDLESRIIHRSSQQGSMFGFTVALYKYGNSNKLLVGAPKYQTEQAGIWNGGAVLSCSATQSNRVCSYVPFDIEGNDVNDLGITVGNKTHQLFGATLRSSKENGIVVACAPNYIWFTEGLDRHEPVGTCFVARQELTDFEEYSPCRNFKWGYHRQGFCQAGFDVALSSDGNRMFVGAPGAYYWQGQIHSQSLIVENDYVATKESPEVDDDQYLGYAVSSGDFNGDGISDVAMGVPKGLNHTGKISLYTHDLNWIQNITGEQLGSYFGYCLSVIDFNNDQLDDIIVGAPFYTNFEDREMKIEVGKVYVFLQNSAHRFRESVEYTGTHTKGRFGLSLTSLGDINYDSYGDFAVGEPYGGDDGKGVVYIFHGTSTREELSAKKKNPAQIIRAAAVNAGLTFGWSLSGNVDMDDNQYPDLLIGAYESEQAFLLKSRPIIKFSVHDLSFDSKGKTIDITTFNCRIRKKDFVCMNLEFCLSYYGVNVDKKIDLNLIYHLDTKQKTEQRMFFKSNDLSHLEKKVSFHSERKKCQRHMTYVKNGIVDKLTSITANVSYSLVKEVRPARSLHPILNEDSTLSTQDSLTIQKNCGPDNVCVPDLVLSFHAPDEFEIGGSKEMVNVSVGVVNEGEDAFEAAIYITEPKGLKFKKYEPQEQASCSTRKIGGKPYIKCDIGNPLPAKQKVNFNVLFEQYGELENEYFEFVVTANSTNGEEASSVSNNIIRKRVEARIDADIALFGTSEPEILIYNTTLYTVPIRLHEKDFGPSLIHKYGLVNKGPAVIENVEIFILWPLRTLSGNYLLYLLEQPITSGNIRCDPLTHLNPYNLELISDEEKARAIGISSFDKHYIVDSESEVTVDGYEHSFSTSSGGSDGSYSSSIRGGGGYSTSSSSSSSSSSKSSSSSSSSSSKSSSSSSGGVSVESRGSKSFSSSSNGTSEGVDSHGARGGSSSSTIHTSSRGGSNQRGHESKTGGTETSILSSSSNSNRSRSEAGLANTLNIGRQGGLSTTLFEPAINGGESGNNQEREESESHSSSSDRRGSTGVRGGSASTSTGVRGGSVSTSTGIRGGSVSTSTEVRGGSVSTSSVVREGSVSSSTRVGGGSVSSSEGHNSGGSYTYQESKGSKTGGGGGSVSTRLSGASGGGRGYDGSEYYERVHTQNSISSPSSSLGGSSVSQATGAGAGGNYYSNTRESSKTTFYSSASETDGSHSTSNIGDDFNGKSRSGVDVREESYYTSTGGRETIPAHLGHSYFSPSSRAEAAGGGGGDADSSTSYHYQYSSSSSGHDNNEIRSRKKRDAHEDFANIVKQCGNEVCTRIKCHTSHLEKDEDVYIYIRSRLFVDTLKEDDMFVYPEENLQITTKMVTKAYIKNYGVKKEFIKVDSTNITTPIRPAHSFSDAPPIPWWVILLATLAGLLILTVIILVLWKCGYFKRHRPKHKAYIADDAHPLNPPATNGAATRNGVNGHRSPHYYPGDEAL